MLGGTLLALLGGVLLGRRAMAPIAALTAAARDIERTRDPAKRSPSRAPTTRSPSSPRTLQDMLDALEASREETEGALHRQRQFVADASHELRTPLTSILANLELLAEVLDGERGEAARSALRSSQRMRRLVGDLLLLARADANRQQPREPTDLAAVLVDAAAELGPVADGHHLTVDADDAVVDGARDELHRMALNLMENAVRHTPPGTPRPRARSARDDGEVVLVVEDDGPGVRPSCASASSSASSAATATAAPRAASACRSSAPWPSRTAAASSSRTPIRARASSSACPAAEVPARESERRCPPRPAARAKVQVVARRPGPRRARGSVRRVRAPREPVALRPTTSPMRRRTRRRRTGDVEPLAVRPRTAARSFAAGHLRARHARPQRSPGARRRARASRAVAARGHAQQPTARRPSVRRPASSARAAPEAGTVTRCGSRHRPDLARVWPALTTPAGTSAGRCRQRRPRAASPVEQRDRDHGAAPLDLDDDRQHHRPPAQAVVDELGEVVVEDLLQEVDLADLLLAARASEASTVSRMSSSRCSALVGVRARRGR